MGLGPNNSSLLKRTGHAFEMTLDWLTMDRQERGQARRIAAIKWSMKHKKQQKPVAPVSPSDSKHRVWMWEGEDIPSKGIRTGCWYQADDIRRWGFKLPKLEKKGKNGNLG